MWENPYNRNWNFTCTLNIKYKDEQCHANFWKRENLSYLPRFFFFLFTFHKWGEDLISVGAGRKEVHLVQAIKIKAVFLTHSPILAQPCQPKPLNLRFPFILINLTGCYVVTFVLAFRTELFMEKPESSYKQNKAFVFTTVERFIFIRLKVLDLNYTCDANRQRTREWVSINVPQITTQTSKMFAQ